MVISRRVSSPPSASNAKRVITAGTVPAVPASLGGDTWGGTWHGSWGRTWLSVAGGTTAVSASPVQNATARVAGTASGGFTRRVTGA